jgi:hypothetical protein
VQGQCGEGGTRARDRTNNLVTNPPIAATRISAGRPGATHRATIRQYRETTPAVSLAREHQLDVGGLGLVFPAQRIEQALPIDFELLFVFEILHFDQMAVDPFRRLMILHHPFVLGNPWSCLRSASGPEGTAENVCSLLVLLFMALFHRRWRSISTEAIRE